MVVAQQGCKYNMDINPVYAVDWSNHASGKRLSATKRRVRFRFGFSDADAVAAGETGVNCRGEEHDVSLVWSLTSGKRLVIADDKEIHFSCGKVTDTKFETSWQMAGGHTVKLIAHASPPLFTTPGFRQFEMFLDGCSYFDMPKIYQLGNKNKQSIVAVPRSPSGAYNNYTLPPEGERRHFAERPGLQEHRAQSSEPALEVSQPVDVLEASSKSLQLDLLDCAPTSSTELATPQDEFAPAEAPQPTFDDVANQIMTAYAPPAITNEPYQNQQSLPAIANEPHTYQAPHAPVTPQGYYQQPQQQQQNYYQQPQQQQQSYYEQPQQTYYEQPQQTYYEQQPTQPVYQQPQAVPVSPDESQAMVAQQQEQPPQPAVLTMEPLCLEEIEQREAPPMSDFDQAVNSLVNLSDIAETRETPEQRKARQSKVQPVCSKPLPPTKADWTLGMNAKLGDIKEHAPLKAPPPKEVMRTHAFDPAAVQAGMMVVYGATNHYQQQQQQALPYSNQVGFGYQQQQQQQAYAAY